MTAPNEERPALYSRIFIAIFTIIMTPIGGAILFCVNLKNTGRLKSIPFVMGGALLYEFLHIKLLSRATAVSSDQIFVPFLIAALLLSFPIWRILLRGVGRYKLLPAWIPLAVAIVAWTAFLLSINKLHI